MRQLDMTKLATLTTANELLDKKYGKEGSASRAQFDKESQEWYENQTTSSYHITMPKMLHSTLAATAKEKGLSISAFVNQLIMRELQIAY